MNTHLLYCALALASVFFHLLHLKHRKAFSEYASHEYSETSLKFHTLSIKAAMYRNLFIAASIAVFLFMPRPASAGDLNLDIGAGYKINGTYIDDPKFNRYNDSKGPTAYIAISYEINNWRIELAHDSNWLLGRPFNAAKEQHLTQFRIVKRFRIFEF
jgi:hypothetical protein